MGFTTQWLHGSNREVVRSSALILLSYLGEMSVEAGGDDRP